MLIKNYLLYVTVTADTRIIDAEPSYVPFASICKKFTANRRTPFPFIITHFSFICEMSTGMLSGRNNLKSTDFDIISQRLHSALVSRLRLAAGAPTSVLQSSSANPSSKTRPSLLSPLARSLEMWPRPVLLALTTILAFCGASPLAGRRPVVVSREAEERAARLCKNNPLQDLWEMLQPHLTNKNIDLTLALKTLELYYPDRYRLLMDEFSSWTMCYIELGVPPPSYTP